MFYLIDRKRLMNEHIHNLKRGKGTLNWFVSPDGILNVIIDREGAKYLYREPMVSANEDTLLKLMIDPRLNILGVVEYEEGKKPKSAQDLMDEVKDNA